MEMDLAKVDRREKQEYLSKMKDIISKPGSLYYSPGPAHLTDHLFLGNREHANNRSLLRRLKITHVLNCAARKDYSAKWVDNPYSEDNLAYEEFEADDNAAYPIMMHFTKAKAFIDSARRLNGKVLVHCEMGVNRSGALCVGYLMVDEGITLLSALRKVKYQRPVVLCNEGFQKQLIEFADQRGLLYSN